MGSEKTGIDMRPYTGGYLFNFYDYFLTVNVTRIHEHTSGDVTGEVMIRNTNPKYTQYVLVTRLNFLSSSTRKSIAKDLDAKYKSRSIDWTAVIETVSVQILEHLREGDPVKVLTAPDGTKPPEFLLYPFIIKDDPNVIFGDPASQKSLFAVIMSQILHTAWLDNPLKLVPPPHPVKTLWLDWENYGDKVEWQMYRLRRGMKLPEVNLPHRRCYLPLVNDITQISRLVMETNPDVIFIDSLAPSAGGDLNKPETAVGFQTELAKLKKTSVVLAHNSKGFEGSSKSIFGSTFFTALSRNIWEAQVVKEAGVESTRMILTNRKSPPNTGLVKPRQYKFDFTPNTIMVSTCEDGEIHLNETSILTISGKIKEFLRGGARNYEEICDATQINYQTARQYISKLTKSGVIVKVGEDFGLKEDYDL